MLAGFHDRYPGVVITLTEDNSDRLAGLLRDGQLDLALGVEFRAVRNPAARVLIEHARTLVLRPAATAAASSAAAAD